MSSIVGKFLGKVKLSDWIICNSDASIDWEPEVEVWLSDKHVYQVHRPSKRCRHADILTNAARSYSDWRTNMKMPSLPEK